MIVLLYTHMVPFHQLTNDGDFLPKKREKKLNNGHIEGVKKMDLSLHRALGLVRRKVVSIKGTKSRSHSEKNGGQFVSLKWIESEL